MHPFDGESDNLILVVEYCSIHYVDEILELLQSAGIFVFFIPPSPTLSN